MSPGTLRSGLFLVRDPDFGLVLRGMSITANNRGFRGASAKSIARRWPR